MVFCSAQALAVVTVIMILNYDGSVWDAMPHSLLAAILFLGLRQVIFDDREVLQVLGDGCS